MTNTFCILMGIVDILAGLLIILGFGAHFIAIVFGIIMITKGGISFL